jgi:hypothetical protein
MPGKKIPYALHNNSEQRRPRLRRGVSLKFRKHLPVFIKFFFRFRQNSLNWYIPRKLQRESFEKIDGEKDVLNLGL